MIGRVPSIAEVRVLVPSEFRKCVAYLAVDVQDDETGAVVRTALGTGFFVTVPVEDVGHAVYLVTARHVIDSSRPYERLFARLNLPAGGFVDVDVPSPDEWEMHPRTDVAAVVAAIAVERLDVKAVPVEMFLGEERIKAATGHPLGEGDEVVLIGLFTSNPGQSRSEPVVRFGHVSRMPYEPIPIKMDPAPDGAYTPVKAYLVEATSYGGQSGSPTFLYFAPDRVPGSISVGGPNGAFALLGLVHGHYPHKQKVKVTSGEITGEGKIDFNLGISVVIPAQDIIDVLNTEVFMEHRKKGADALRARRAPTPDGPKGDSAIEPAANEEFDRFQHLTKQLVNTPKPEKEGEEN
jgi:hypothetical protein